MSTNKDIQDELCKALYEAVQRFYENEENIKEYELWLKSREVKNV